MASTTPSALERLPPEILSMIADFVAPLCRTREDDRAGFKDLKALRASCQTFAYLRPLQATLFHTIQLIASPACVKAIVSGSSLTRSASFVRRIIFVPWKYSWDMEQSVFETILVQRGIALLRKEASEDRIKAKQNPSQQSVRWKCSDSMIRSKGSRRVQFIDAEDLSRQFTVYQAHAKYSKYLYESGEFVRVWSRFTRSLPNVSEFSIRHWEFDGVESEADDVDCDFFAHSHTSLGHPEWHCRDLQASVGDALFDSVILTLIRAKAKCRELDIAQVSDGKMSWIDRGLLQDVDLSNLTVLRFRPQAQKKDRSFPDLDTQYEAFTLHGRRALDQITRKCSQTLKHLEVGNIGIASQLDFPPKGMVQLPKLESLFVYSAIRVPGLANVIHSAKNLQRLRIHPYIVIYGSYRHILRAIRHHPNDMLFSCRLRVLEYYLELENYTRGDAVPGRVESSQLSDEQHASLVRYLSRKGTWNYHCKTSIGFDMDTGLETDGESSDESLEPFEKLSDGWSDLSDAGEPF